MSQIIEVLSVNISEKKGTIKTPRPSITINEKGVVNDAHAGDWHRQVSLLADESIRRFETKLDRRLEYGEFAENITTRGIVLHETTPGDKFFIGETELEVTQIGKKCHGDDCQIFQLVGSCVMPKEGIFCKVIKGGIIKPGDTIVYKKSL
jgi:MOSC domain-containing protein YiiM